ncbi:penicillin-binding protein 2 [Marinitoga hydrogenitolerans DSM 16785]|uniref:Penicillin-binding protein 2 n=1 Tax=Marinitoga hydrogenitolerans (strain DSM 16785 / JCM 12826 / AT1271) TaxID=1122195 RepID=A0A1M4VPJ4_MARH1|nr:penicillin-binding transpeptidase domain-containing protein [Marinitoga hydrogenitolerans]SHE70858.1 penicillin-binding protein 2 [Marinitoga hydrogenitolerans DSM 16785]
MKESRFETLVVLFLFSFFILGARAAYIQLINHAKYEKEVEELSTRIITLNPIRGNIYDKNGVLLAWNEKVYVIENFNESFSEEDIKLLKNIFSSITDSPETLIDKLIFQKNLTVNLTPANIKQILNIKGIRISEKYIRKYRDKSLYPIIGYVNSEGKPLYGVEKVYNNVLEGKPGYQIVKITPGGRIDKVLETVEPIKGMDLYLTIDYYLQKYIYDEIEKYKKPGAVIMSNPNNGDILALVSYPAVEPNLFSSGLSIQEWKKIIYDTKQPLINRAISSVYPPGSVIKPFFALVGLEEGISPEATIFCDGKFELKNSKDKVIAEYYDWNIFGHGVTDLVKSLRVSCNLYYYNLGLNLGIDTMSSYAKMFEINRKTDIDLTGEVKSVFPSREWKKEKFGKDWFIGETVLTSIGQGYMQFTPISILRLYNILSTKGKYYQFHVLKRYVKNMSEDVVNYEKKLTFVHNINPLDYFNILKGLIEVTTYPGNSSDGGTAYHVFKDFKGLVAGKTGTAEVTGGKSAHSWFAGFMPANNPEVSIVSFVENGGYGSEVAAPIAKKALEKYLELKNTNK